MQVVGEQEEDEELSLTKYRIRYRYLFFSIFLSSIYLGPKSVLSQVNCVRLVYFEHHHKHSHCHHPPFDNVIKSSDRAFVKFWWCESGGKAQWNFHCKNIVTPNYFNWWNIILCCDDAECSDAVSVGNSSRECMKFPKSFSPTIRPNCLHSLNCWKTIFLCGEPSYS